MALKVLFRALTAFEALDLVEDRRSTPTPISILLTTLEAAHCFLRCCFIAGGSTESDDSRIWCFDLLRFEDFLIGVRLCDDDAFRTISCAECFVFFGFGRGFRFDILVIFGFGFLGRPEALCTAEVDDFGFLGRADALCTVEADDEGRFLLILIGVRLVGGIYGASPAEGVGVGVGVGVGAGVGVGVLEDSLCGAARFFFRS